MSIHRNQDMIDITVSDNGAGMTEEMIAKVMEEEQCRMKKTAILQESRYLMS